MSLQVGTLVKLIIPCMGNEVGTPGYVYEDYEEGCQIIFSNGEYCGFSNGELSDFIETTGLSTMGYTFTNVMQLSRDFEGGYFNSVLGIR